MQGDEGRIRTRTPRDLLRRPCERSGRAERTRLAAWAVGPDATGPIRWALPAAVAGASVVLGLLLPTLRAALG